MYVSLHAGPRFSRKPDNSLFSRLKEHKPRDIMPPRMRRRITTATREEIDRQQKALSKSINRPFDLVSNLPVSYNEPESYEQMFKTPLTVKDTGVLYLSLLRSRHCYVYDGPMFALYWIKQSAYAKKMAAQDSKYYEKVQNDPNSDARQPILFGDVSARDVMVKLCDGTLDLGPHNFEIRMFIAKDERSDKKKKKDKDVKEENGEKSTTPVSTDVKAAPNATPVPHPSSTGQSASAEPAAVQQSPPPANATPVSSTPKNSSLATSNNPAANTTNTTEPAETTSSNEPKVPSSTNASTAQDTLSKAASSPSKPDDTSAQETPSTTPAQPAPATQPAANPAPRQRLTLTNLKSKVLPNDSSSPTITPPTVPINRPQVKVGNNTSNPSSQPQTPGSDSNQTETAVPERPISPPTVRAPPPRSDPSNMQSVENTIMIANLNAIARVDASLNALMKIVALGNASPQQIMTFQGYIQRAREMGPQPHHAYLFPNYFQNGRYVKSSTVRERKPKVPRDQKLTAFQEKYVRDATVLFEFAENSNVRYQLPKDAIAEVLPQSKENIEADEKDILFSFLWIHNQKEVEEYEKNKKEYEDFVKKKEEDKRREEEEAKKKEEEEKKKAEEAEKTTVDAVSTETKGTEEDLKDEQDAEKGVSKKPTQENDGDVEMKDGEEQVKQEPGEEDANEAPPATEDAEPAPTRKLPPRRGKKGKRVPPPRKPRPPKEPELPVEPEIRFTAMSFTIHKVPSRFVPIIANSVNPLNKVQERMKHILEVGTRTSNYYLWYQVDGKQDEALAEKVRVQLHQEEKKLNGIVVTGTGTTALSLKKRKLMKPDPIRKGDQ